MRTSSATLPPEPVEEVESPDLSEEPVVAILGPTGTGKSSFAVRVALALGGEVVSCDSMAVYRGLDIGTAKPTPEERRGVPHHLLDVAEPGTTFSAGAFRAQALAALTDIRSRGRLPILVGGTGLYARALLQGLAHAPPSREPLRERLLARGSGRLNALLRRLDPARAAELPPRDTLRIVRALEVRLESGRPMSALLAEQPFGASGLRRVFRIGLTGPRPLLYNRIEARVDDMMARGFLQEVRGLLSAGVLRGPVAKAIGYGELAAHLAGELPLDEAVARIKQRSRNLAKRQLTWFRRESGTHWYTIDREAWESHAVERIQRWWEAPAGQP